jgi:hypothetical protein
MLTDEDKKAARTQAVLAINRHPNERRAAIDLATKNIQVKYKSIWTMIAIQIAIRLATALIMYWISNNILPKIEGFQTGEPQDV